VGVDTIDPEGDDLPKEKAVAKYAYSKGEYSYKCLVDSAESSVYRINDVDVVSEEVKKEMLKFLDSSIISLEVFNLPEGHHIGIRQFQYEPNGNTSIGFEVFDENYNRLDVSGLFISAPNQSGVQERLASPINRFFT